MLGIGCQNLAVSAGIGRNDLAVIPAGDDARTIRGHSENAARMNRHALLAATCCNKQQRLLAKHEDRAVLQEMRLDDGSAGGNRLHAIGDGGNGAAGVGHGD